RVGRTGGDTDLRGRGGGAGGASAIPCGGASVAGATRKLAETLKETAADALETAVSDLEIAEGGAVRVAGTDRLIAFADLARRSEARQRVLVAEDAFVPQEATLSQRHPSRRGRDRPGYRRNAPPELLGGGRFRRSAQPVAAGRPGPWRHGARHRAGVDGERGLRRFLRTAHQRLVDGLCPAARGRYPAARLRDLQRAVPDQSAGGEGGGG